MQPLTRRAGLAVTALVLSLAVASCGGGSSPTQPSGPAAGTVTAYLGNNQPGLVGYGVNVRPAVRLVDTLGNPRAGVAVTFAVTGGGGSVTGGTTSTNANGVAQVGQWTLGGSPGVNAMTATVSAGVGRVIGSPVVFKDTALAQGLTIQVQYFGPPPNATTQAAMSAAATKWQSIIYRALSNIQLNKAAGACGANEPAVTATTTGMIIQAEFDSIDGPGKILGQAGPCMVRTPSGLTVLGVMEFDTADVAALINQGLLNTVMLHEMGHVIGFGTLWDNPPNACLQDTSGSSPKVVNDTYFSCAKARAAFDSIGGLSYTGASLSPPGGNKVPVENCGASSPTGCGLGTVNSHWREPVFGNELMTGYVNSGQNPLSVVTIAAQEDLGYTVNYGAADSYIKTFTAPAVAGRGVFLGNDVRRGPLYLVDARGAIRAVLRR